MKKILYNVTISLDESIHQDWLKWMQDIHIPEVMASGCFIEYRMLRMLNEENNGITYAMQYLASSLSDYERYRDKFAPKLQKDGMDLFGGKFAAFRTLLELIEP